MNRIVRGIFLLLTASAIAACASPTTVFSEEAFALEQTSVSADSVQPGQSVSVSTEVASSMDANGIIVHLQIFDANNDSVAKQSWEGQNFRHGEALAYSFDWSIPIHQYAGDYVVSVGIFDQHWSQLKWFDSQATMSIVKPAGPAGQALPVASLTLDSAPLDRLPGHFGLGVKADRRGDFDWMAETGTPFDYSYGYLAGGVNTGESWADWSSPPGDYALRFMESSDERGYIPVFSYYQIVQSLPNRGQEPPLNNLLDPGTMTAYFDDWILLMKAAADFGKPVIIHQEPDLWGYLQKKSDDPTEGHVAVGASGHPDVAGLEDNGRGLAQALVKLRNDYAPNVLLAWHANPWAAGADLTLQNADGIVLGKRVADFFLSLKAPFDLIFYGVSDRDAAWREARKSQDALWDQDDYERFYDFMSVIQGKTGLKSMIWQIPLGNTLYRSMNNQPGHFQDNHVEYYLLPENRQHLVDHAEIGVIGLLFGGGAAEQTRYTDAARDGVTNPEPINGNDLMADYPDDDGGLLRITSRSFYEQGPLPVR